MQDLEFRQLVERIKLRSPIEEIVGDRVPELRRRGTLYWARCPFHEERTPSFAVDPRRGTWHCYGACGEGGDALSFVQRFDGLSFLDALRLLAQACGETVPEDARRQRRGQRDGSEERLEALRGVLVRAQRHYAKLLDAPEGQPARDYLASRGFAPAVVRAFGLGWSPEAGSPLLEAARRAGVPEEHLVEAGLVKRAEPEPGGPGGPAGSGGARLYDFFRGRLMIPVEDRLGRIAGFGGRVLATGEGRQAAKYVNTPETPLFHKGRLIYGLARAAESVRRSHHVVLVEGYTDVIAAHQAGVPNVVAVLGTATTAEHAELIRRSGARRVTLIFDGDEAGRSASRRALQGLLSLGLAIDVASPPPGRDPCDLLLAPDGKETFERLLASARDWLDWSVAGLAGRRGPELAGAVDELLELLLALQKPVEREARLGELAQGLGLAPAGVREQWEQVRRRAEQRAAARDPRPGAGPGPDGRGTGPGKGAPRGGSPARGAGGPPGPSEEHVFRSLLGALLLDNSLIPLYGNLAGECPPGDLRVLFEALLDLYEHGEDLETIDAMALLGALGDHPARDLVLGLEQHARTAESPLALARDQARWIADRKRRHTLNELTERLARSGHDSEGDAEKDVLEHIHQELRRVKVPSSGTDAGPVPIP